MADIRLEQPKDWRENAGLTFRDAVEVALCFGWIDSTRK